MDQGLGHLGQYDPEVGEDDIRLMRENYGELKRVLLEVDREAMNALSREFPNQPPLINILMSLGFSGSHLAAACALPLP